MPKEILSGGEPSKKMGRVRVVPLLVGLAAVASCGPEEIFPTPRVVAGDSASTRTSNPCGALEGTLAFASYRDGESEIYTINTGVGEPTRLTDNEERLSKPIWSPNAEAIAYVVTADSGSLNIYVMDANGSNQIQLTTELRVDTEPAWDPSGEHIAFSSGRDSYVNIDDRMAYELVSEFEIYVMNADGSEQTNLTNSPGWDTAPAWSPDGNQIAFQSNRDGYPETYVMNADGSNQTNLTNHRGDDAAPAWSPDGSKIVFHSDRAGDFNLFAMNTDGSDLFQLTDNPDWDIEAAWSPDGKRIAFYSGRDGNFEVYVMNADGSCQERLTYDIDFDGFPDWRP